MFDRRFLGRGWGFPPQFDVEQRDVRMVAGEDDIRESLHILFTTSAGERIMRSAFGGGVDRHVFTRVDATVLTALRGAIRKAVLHHEPRITLDEVVAHTGEMGDGRILFEVRYHVRDTNTRSNAVFPFYFEEGTNLQLPP